MSFDAQTLFELLPAVHRARDGELARDNNLPRGPLEELITVLAEQIGVAEESLDQLYDDLFIETCADWVVPYIGDLIGYQSLHGVVPKVASPRAEVAHTIALRRRKGTALVLEQLARDVTGWDARAVEYFQRLITTQYMNHTRPDNLQAPDMRDGNRLEWLGSAFESANRTVDVRHIESRRGRHNIANVGLHLWRIQAYPHRQSLAVRVGPRRYRVSPLNHDVALYNKPLAEDNIFHLAEPDNVPLPLSRRRLGRHLQRYYGYRPSSGAAEDNPSPSLMLSVDDVPIERDQIHICNLSDEAGGWAHTPPENGIYAIDPLLGRIALPLDAADPAQLTISWQEGFSADVGGGEYERGASLPSPAAGVQVISVPTVEHATITAALADLGGDGVIEITDNGHYQETLNIVVMAEGSVEIRASNGRRPVLELAGLTVSGGENSSCVLNGLLITGAALQVPDADNELAVLSLLHCTLVPGLALNPDGSAQQPASPALEFAIAGLEVLVERSIVGAIRSHQRSYISATDSVIDATAAELVAFAGADGESAGAQLSLSACTVIGKIHSAEIGLISNSILFGRLAEGDSWTVPVRTQRKQQGCVRFSWLPFEAIVPRRHRCQPASALAAQQLAPRFSSLRYGTPAYAQLLISTPNEILRGADDESEMGVLHHLYGAQRETNLRIRLAEYLRVGLKAGIFYQS